MSKKNQVLGQLASFASASQLTQLITVLTGIFSRNFLGPEQMGIWATLQVILSYASYSALGTSVAIARKIPFYLGKKEDESAVQVKNLVFTYQTVFSIITSAALLLSAVVFRQRMGQGLFWGLLGAGIILVLQRLNGLQISVLRAYKQFGTASRFMVWSAIVNLILVFILAPFFKLPGFILAMVLSFLFNIGYCSRHFDFNFKFTMNSEIKRILAFAFPLMVFGFAESFFKTIDKVVIVRMLGFESLGYYTVAIMFSNFLAQIPNSFGIVMIPHFEEKYGEKESLHDLLPYVEKSLRGLSCGMTVIAGLAWIVTPTIVTLLMPSYVQGIAAAQSLVLASYFMALTIPYTTVIVTLNKQLYLLPLILLVLAISALINVLMIKLGLGINGVAFGMILSFLFYFLCFHILLNRLFSNAGAAVLSSVSYMLRFGFLVLAVTLIGYLFPYTGGLWGAFLKSGFFIILMLPVFLSLEREHRIFSVMMKKIAEVFRGKGPEGVSKKIKSEVPSSESDDERLDIL